MLGAVLVAGAGCTTTSTTNTNTAAANANVTTVAVDDTADAEADVVVDDANTAIEILSPVNGVTVASTFDVTVDITDFTLAPDAVEGANVEGEGHYHVFVDGEYVVAGVAETATLADLAVGEHEIYVSLQNNDHSNLAPVVKSDTITVTVE